MTVAPLIAMKSTKCESLEAVGKERVNGRSAPSTLSLPKSARKVDFGMEPWGGKPNP